MSCSFRWFSVIAICFIAGVLSARPIDAATLLGPATWGNPNLVVACMLLGVVTAQAAPAGNLVVGVNVLGVQRMNEQQQDALIEQLRKAGVNTIRTGISSLAPAEGLTHFVTNAYKRGIGTLLIVNPTEGGTGLHTRPAIPPHDWAQPPMSDADPESFRKWFASLLGTFEASGVRLTAIEFGNEINNSQFNGDFTLEMTSHRVLGINDLNNPNDPEGKKLSAGFRTYLKVLAVLKQIRDHSKLNQVTPIISAGLVGGFPGKSGGFLDAVAGFDTLEFLRQNGLDDLVDGYGIHSYPSLNPNRTTTYRVNELDNEFFKACGRGTKPCWLTEWGFTNSDKTCPLKDDTRTKVVSVMMQAYKVLADQGKLANITYFSWGDPDDGIFRCGALTDAGKLALRPM
jgi:hypothetical protein